MRPRACVVAHPERLAAEGIAEAVARYPVVVVVGVATTASEVERFAERAEVVAIDARVRGAEPAIERLRAAGVRVVVMGPSETAVEDDGGIVVPLDQPVSRLIAALVPGTRARSVTPLTEGLTRREREVLRFAAKGMAGKQIATTMGISPKTVEQHKTRAFRRLGVPNQAAAVALLVQGGH
jgi:DNA-binding CsgD family transcriptional regulator